MLPGREICPQASCLEDRIVKKSQAKKFWEPHKDWSEPGVGPLRIDVFRKGNNFKTFLNKRQCQRYLTRTKEKKHRADAQPSS